MLGSDCGCEFLRFARALQLNIPVCLQLPTPRHAVFCGCRETAHRHSQGYFGASVGVVYQKVRAPDLFIVFFICFQNHRLVFQQISNSKSISFNLTETVEYFNNLVVRTIHTGQKVRIVPVQRLSLVHSKVPVRPCVQSGRAVLAS